MNESSSTPSPEETTQTGHCPVSWCTTDHLNTSEPDHFGSTGPLSWATVHATGDVAMSGVAELTFRPLWSESEGFDPTVSLYIERDAFKRSPAVQLEVDLRLDEAERLAVLLQHATAAARRPTEPLVEPEDDSRPRRRAKLGSASEALCDVIEELHKLEGRIDDVMRSIEQRG